MSEFIVFCVGAITGGFLTCVAIIIAAMTKMDVSRNENTSNPRSRGK